jgi:hypothetical protein
MTVMHSSVSKNSVRADQLTLPYWAHPSVKYWLGEYQTIRDCIEGERAVKEEGRQYLPQSESMESADYQAFQERATFYGFTGKTVNALVGTIFKHPAKISGVPANLQPRLESLSIDGMNAKTYVQFIAKEVIALGRVGVLLDMDTTETTEPQPYLAHYTAEHILDWTYDTYKGRKRLREVVLREPYMASREDLKLTTTTPGADVVSHALAIAQQSASNYNAASSGGPSRRFYASYRRLSLELMPDPTNTDSRKWTYVQRVYKTANRNAILADTDQDGTEIIPTIRGKTLDTIPFHCFGTVASTLDIEKPEMIDIARLNISHYRSYAILEQGRWFTGSPQYHVEVNNDTTGQYKLGVNMVWEHPVGTKPGILEFNGGGLKSLETALLSKEAQAAALGGRMIGLTASSTAESTDVAKMKQANEHSLLLSVCNSIESGFNTLMQQWIDWQSVSKSSAKFELKLSRSFMVDNAGAREFRAIQSMYQAGVIPIEVLHAYLTQYDVIPADMEIEEFVALLTDTKSFPGQPDAVARKAGFTNRKDQLAAEIAKAQLVLDQQAADDATTIADAKAGLNDILAQNADSLQTLNEALAILSLAQAGAQEAQATLIAAQEKVAIATAAKTKIDGKVALKNSNKPAPTPGVAPGATPGVVPGKPAPKPAPPKPAMS